MISNNSLTDKVLPAEQSIQSPCRVANFIQTAVIRLAQIAETPLQAQ